jgi:hypothetical protein
MLSAGRISLLSSWLWLASLSHVNAEPLRIIVMPFSGSGILSGYVMTTLYFEITKAFQYTGDLAKGVWILYGHNKLPQANHDAAIAAAKWPSVRADMVLWGKITPYGEGVVVESFLTITPLVQQREVRPEVWTVQIDVAGRAYTVSKESPALYYEFEPFKIPDEAVLEYSSPRGIPLYSAPRGGYIVGYTGEKFTFRDFRDEAVMLASRNGVIGWADLPKLSDRSIDAVSFSKGLIRFYQGNWLGAIEMFKDVEGNERAPQSLVIDAQIYMGIAYEKLGRSGRELFAKAYGLNRLNRDAASYLAMSMLNQVNRSMSLGDERKASALMDDLSGLIQQVRMLYPADDPWFQNVVEVLSTWGPRS